MDRDNTAAVIADLLRNVTEFRANRYHADLPVCSSCPVKTRSALARKAAINGNVFLSCSEQNIIALERL